MERWGWERGDGLGPSGDGIKAPVRKTDRNGGTEGFGFDPSLTTDEPEEARAEGCQLPPGPVGKMEKAIGGRFPPKKFVKGTTTPPEPLSGKAEPTGRKPSVQR